MRMTWLAQQRVITRLVRSPSPTLYAWSAVIPSVTRKGPPDARSVRAMAMAPTLADRVSAGLCGKNMLTWLADCLVLTSVSCYKKPRMVQVPNRVAVGQMTSTGDHNANLAVCRRLAEQARETGDACTKPDQSCRMQIPPGLPNEPWRCGAGCGGAVQHALPAGVLRVHRLELR